MPIPLAPTPFRAMVESLLQHLARHGVLRRVHGPLLAMIWNHIRAIERRVLGLLARIEAGTLRRHPGRRPAARSGPRRRPAPSALPRGTLWLVRLVQETAQIAPELRDMVTHPDLAARLEQAPQLRRALRPLCVMLGVALPRPAPNPAPARSEQPAPARAPTPPRANPAPCTAPPRHPPAPSQALAAPARAAKPA